ncbi:uncharacterized protein DS421_1g11880 [Arachis hypogaea]|nr:uncharacterized protein DS421_1g11880 [Arachis hypogaea]
MFSLSLQLALSRLWFILSHRRLLACTAVFSSVPLSARPTACLDSNFCFDVDVELSFLNLEVDAGIVGELSCLLEVELVELSFLKPVVSVVVVLEDDELLEKRFSDSMVLVLVWFLAEMLLLDLSVLTFDGKLSNFSSRKRGNHGNSGVNVGAVGQCDPSQPESSTVDNVHGHCFGLFSSILCLGLLIQLM